MKSVADKIRATTGAKGWAEEARAAIARAHLSMPEGVTPKERKRALRDAYPFGARSGWAYKAWLREQKKYLARFPDPSKLKQSPLFRAARGLSADKPKRPRKLTYVGRLTDAQGPHTVFMCKACGHKARVTDDELGPALAKAPLCPHCNGGTQK